MTRVAYVNGHYVDHAEAAVHVEDRGYQFADGVYEYIAFYNQILFDAIPHLERLERSCGELKIDLPMSLNAMQIVIQELISRNGRQHGGLYIQVTRGVALRDHPFPKASKPALVMTIRSAKLTSESDLKKGVKAITYKENRWARRDIKSISLLGNVLAKQEAVSQKAKEAWLVDEKGMITEGAVCNVYIIKDGTLITHPKNENILGGIARERTLEIAQSLQIKVKEQPFGLQDIRQADEAFMTSTSINILPVTQVDDMVIGSGKPGQHTMKMHEEYMENIKEQTGFEG